MSVPDVQIHPVATGAAKQVVEKHQAEQPFVFYAGWFCPYVQRVWSALELKGVDYQYKEINPYKKEPHFLAINPKGLVPAVEVRGKALYESVVLLELLDDIFPQAKRIYPHDPIEKALARMQIDAINKKIMPSYFKTIQNQDPAAQSSSRAELVSALRDFSSYIPSGSTYVGGSEPSAVDLTLAPWMARFWVIETHRGGPLTEEEVGAPFLAWKSAIESHPAIVNTNSEREHYVPIYDRYLKDEAQSEAAKAIRAGKVIP